MLVSMSPPRDWMLPKLDTLLHQCPGSFCFHNVGIGTWIMIMVFLNSGSNDSSHIGPFLFFQIVAVVVVSLMVFLFWFVFLLLLQPIMVISEPPLLCRIPWGKVESVGVFFWEHSSCILKCFVRLASICVVAGVDVTFCEHCLLFA